MMQTSSAPPPPRDRLRTGRKIAVGSVEKLAGSRVLRCTANGSSAEVALFVGDQAVGSPLTYNAPAVLKDGDLIDEGEFSRVLDAYRINSPWHDGEYTCLVLTVECLRKNQDNELLTFKDL